MNAALRLLLPAALAAGFLLSAPLTASAGSFTFGDDVDFEYALIEPSDDGNKMVTSGSWRRIEPVLEKYDGPLFWFARDGGAWIIRDPALLAEARRIVQPMHELGKKQGKLGTQQGKLGSQQGRLGAQQGRLGAQQGKLGAKLSRLATSAAFDDDADRASEEEIRRIELEMEELSREQAALARKQEPLAEQQRALGEQQEELGRQQSAATKKASAELRRLADRAIDSGKTTRVED